MQTDRRTDRQTSRQAHTLCVYHALCPVFLYHLGRLPAGKLFILPAPSLERKKESILCAFHPERPSTSKIKPPPAPKPSPPSIPSSVEHPQSIISHSLQIYICIQQCVCLRVRSCLKSGTVRHATTRLIKSIQKLFSKIIK